MLRITCRVVWKTFKFSVTVKGAESKDRLTRGLDKNAFALRL